MHYDKTNCSQNSSIAWLCLPGVNCNIFISSFHSFLTICNSICIVIRKLRTAHLLTPVGCATSLMSPIYKFISTVDVRIDWQMFNIQPNDDQLVDFILSVGDAFPKKDSSGNTVAEIKAIPGTHLFLLLILSTVNHELDSHSFCSFVTSERAVSRPPTELIPNSPDSTPTPSRQDNNDYYSEVSASPTMLPNATGNSVIERPLINVYLRSHEGHEADRPFSFHPSQMVCAFHCEITYYT